MSEEVKLPKDWGKVDGVLVAEPEPSSKMCKKVIDRYLKDQWQPIETAPKDGTKVFVGNSEYGYVFIEHYQKRSTFEGWVSGYNKLSINPTHWMPLPPPPTGESKTT